MITENYKRNCKIIERDIKTFKSEDPEAARIRRDTYCKTCVYKAGELNGTGAHYNSGCDYLLKTGHIRSCAPSECVEMGIYEKKVK